MVSSQVQTQAHLVLRMFRMDMRVFGLGPIMGLCVSIKGLLASRFVQDREVDWWPQKATDGSRNVATSLVASFRLPPARPRPLSV